MTSEEEERVRAIEATTNAASSSSTQAEEAAAIPGGAAEMATGGATTTATAITATTATGAGDAAPPENTRIRDSLEAIKTAVVWLVVINILTVLSPLLQAPLKWTLAIGVLLIVGSLTIGCVAYLKARGAQERRIPE